MATIQVTLSDTGCEPRSISAKAGPTTFEVTNDGSTEVTEFEIIGDDKFLGEVEHVESGTPRSFSVTLEPGTYRTKCPGGEAFDEGTPAVAGAASGVAADEGARSAAVQSYLTYVKSEADQLVQAMGPFVAAVKAGDIAAAQQQFAPARAHYESIEPIAESFGDLDPAIDAREGDVPDNEWAGFHRIEKALWVDNDLTGMSSVADKLQADIAAAAHADRHRRARARADRQRSGRAAQRGLDVQDHRRRGSVQPYGSVGLRRESRRLESSVRVVAPLARGDADESTLSTELDQRFTDVQTALDQHRGADPVGNGYAVFTTLSTDQTRALSTTLDTLAEPLSQVAAQVL